MTICESPRDLRELTRLDQERASQADDSYCRICRDSGLELISWQDFEAWKEYVDGKINESELSEKAKIEIQELSKSFQKYLIVDKKDEPKNRKEEEEKRERAKRANKVYRRVCDEAGVRVSLFRDFRSWSDYVEGKISETEFYERAKTEVQRMLARSS
jgi:hypothetical protein